MALELPGASPLFSACDVLATRWLMWLSPSSLRVAPWGWSLGCEA